MPESVASFESGIDSLTQNSNPLEKRKIFSEIYEELPAELSAENKYYKSAQKEFRFHFFQLNSSN